MLVLRPACLSKPQQLPSINLILDQSQLNTMVTPKLPRCMSHTTHCFQFLSIALHKSKTLEPDTETAVAGCYVSLWGTGWGRGRRKNWLKIGQGWGAFSAFVCHERMWLDKRVSVGALNYWVSDVLYDSDHFMKTGHSKTGWSINRCVCSRRRGFGIFVRHRGLCCFYIV